MRGIDQYILARLSEASAQSNALKSVFLQPRYRPLQDDIASVAFWYQTLPTPVFPKLADRDYLEVR